MLDKPKLPFSASIDGLKALAEPTRLRLMRLLADADLTVSDLTAILGQSQPRISRHLRLLVESGLLTRYQEGAWAYFRASDALDVAALSRAVLGCLADDDPVLRRDVERLEAIRRERATRAADYFSRNAERWDRLRSLHVADADVEVALLELLGSRRFADFLDVGTGTGRLLELLASRVDRAVGVDASREMLQVARAKLDAAGIANAQVRQGDCYCLPLARGGFDLVTIHQVLHYLDDPAAAVREAASMLTPAGVLLIVDFAPHGLDFLREEQAHSRLGFSAETLGAYLGDAGLELVATRTLAPGTDASPQLTTVLTLARDRRAAVSRTHPAPGAALATERA